MLRDDLLEELLKIPVIDVHSHLPRDRMASPKLDTILRYHMINYPMRSAGMPEEILWPEYPDAVSEDELYANWIKHWPGMENTGFAWMLKRILKDLYEFDEPITEKSLPKLRDAFAAKVGRPDWARSVMENAGIVRVLSSHCDVPPLEKGDWDGNIRFTIEDTPSSGMREYRTWRDRLRSMSKGFGKTIDSPRLLQEMMENYYAQFDWSDKNTLVAWISATADFTPISNDTLQAVFDKCLAGHQLNDTEIGYLEAAFLRAICHSISGKAEIFQIVYGIQYLTHNYGRSVQRARPQFASTMGYLLGEFPQIHFNIMNGFELDEPVHCSLCVAYNNVSLSNFWWQSFYASVMHAGWSRRLDVVPVTRLIGFFSDGYCIDWIYARLCMVRKVLANVLAQKIESGFMNREQALLVARNIFYRTPRRIFLPDESCEID
ncbi:MAG: hypothetical protein GF398_13615 [Chitinivibrionales bacterium]|nr:hypothetical protein [Chitinivibrionales bacterium]